MSEAVDNLPQEKLESLGAYAKRAREIQIEIDRLAELQSKLAEEQKANIAAALKKAV